MNVLHTSESWLSDFAQELGIKVRSLNIRLEIQFRTGV